MGTIDSAMVAGKEDSTRNAEDQYPSSNQTSDGLQAACVKPRTPVCGLRLAQSGGRATTKYRQTLQVLLFDER